ncbi:MAG: hypothetical protein SYC29_05800 [Planctomycetota bacterium]|nr:hypothetical protein [Planctomycetota bacterium]
MTEQARTRRKRLAQLLDLAQTYKGWTRKELARNLGRDPTKLVPGSGIPKLDLVVHLADVLDWPVGDMIELLWDNGEPVDNPQANGQTFDDVNQEALKAHREGRYSDLIRLAQRMYMIAEESDQRALACNRECGGWDGLGRYTKALEAAQRGLQEGPITTARRTMLEVNLATSHYSLWHLFEARATASNILDRYRHSPPDSRLHEVVHAHAYYVRGNSLRRMMDVDPSEADRFATMAREDLETARRMYEALAEKYEDDAYSGVANTCKGGLIEVDVALGKREAEDGLIELSDGLDAVIDSSAFPVGDWLESYGWWCVFGCNTALRHLQDEKKLQQFMAVFTNKAEEIAERLDNWAMRERVFTMEYARRQRFHEWTGLESEWTIDQEDVRVVAGTMGRFPNFRRTGWMILQTAKVIRES